MKMMRFFKRVLPVLFLFFSLNAPAQTPKTGFDIHVLYELKKTRTAFQNAFFRTISDINNPVCLAVPLTFLIIGWIRKNRDKKLDALHIAQTIALSQSLSFLIKVLVGRLRPQLFDTSFVPLVYALNKSFPSGHTTEAFAMATSLVFLRLRWYWILPAYCWALMIAYARMYLGVHFPTDVMGGMVLGSGSAWLTYRIIRWAAAHKKEKAAG